MNGLSPTAMLGLGFAWLLFATVAIYLDARNPDTTTEPKEPEQP